MAIYVDPTSATNGAGTEVDPKNAPGNVTGDTYLFRRGTTYSPTGGGKRLRSTPDIGAYRYAAARNIAADRNVRLVGA